MNLILTKELKELLQKLMVNPNGQSTIRELNLPYADENFFIYERDKKIYVELPNAKISYFFMQGNYVSHYELLRRIIYLNGVHIENGSVENYEILKKSVQVLLKGEN